MQKMKESLSASEIFASYSGKRVRRKVLPNLVRASVITGSILGATAAHLHPEVMTMLPPAIVGFATQLTEGITNVSNGVGNFLNHIPTVGFIPHMIETNTPASQVINQQGLTNIEVSLGAESILTLRKMRKQSKKERLFKEDVQEMQQIAAGKKDGQLTLPILQKREGWTIFGDPKSVAEGVLAKPENKWNQARIQEALQTTLLETLKAKDDKVALLKNPRIASQLAGEAAEQTTRIVAKHGLGAVAGTVAGVFFWLGQHYFLTKPEAKKIGAPELVKASWMQFPAAFFPIVGGVLYAAASIPLEIWLRKHLNKINKYVVAGMPEKLSSLPKTQREQYRKEVIKTLVNKTHTNAAVQKEVSELPNTVALLEEEVENSPQIQAVNKELGHLQSVTNSYVAEYTRRQEKSGISRLLHRRRIKLLENTIQANQKKMLTLMHSKLGKGSEEAQLARALASIYRITI